MNITQLHLKRNYEINYAMEIFGDRDQKILEIGAGTGYQTKILHENGFDVTGIDIASSNYADLHVYPVVNYDGFKIPFPDNNFDIVFSSNVMEHVDKERFSELQTEIKRVLKPGCKVVHILPSGSWRFWTSVTYYLTFPRRIMAALKCKRTQNDCNKAKTDKPVGSKDKRNLLTYLLSRTLPPRHGVRGNIFSESYYFSNKFWYGLFAKEAWVIEACHPFGLFYTGYSLLHTHLSIPTRQKLSRFWGRSTHIIILSE